MTFKKDEVQICAYVLTDNDQEIVRTLLRPPAVQRMKTVIAELEQAPELNGIFTPPGEGGAQ